MNTIRNVAVACVLLAFGAGCGEDRHGPVQYPSSCGSHVECYNKALEAFNRAQELLGQAVARAAPLGTVVASAAESEPPGWLKCDGSEKDVATYPQLAQLLGARYGAAPPGKFRLPDYRGYFLRGWDPEQARDKDARAALREGAATGPHVGSKQDGNVGGHGHGYRVYMGGGGNERGYYYDEKLNKDRAVSIGEERRTINDPGGETRPINVSVNYLIKAD
jgi:hypothetical protein